MKNGNLRQQRKHTVTHVFDNVSHQIQHIVRQVVEHERQESVCGRRRAYLPITLIKPMNNFAERKKEWKAGEVECVAKEGHN